jgi:hypothetical protein
MSRQTFSLVSKKLIAALAAALLFFAVAPASAKTFTTACEFQRNRRLFPIFWGSLSSNVPFRVLP